MALKATEEVQLPSKGHSATIKEQHMYFLPFATSKGKLGKLLLLGHETEMNID